MHVQRDPFARGEYSRKTHTDGRACAWCGQRKRRMYTYAWSPDDRSSRNESLHNGRYVFCAFDCFRSFNG